MLEDIDKASLGVVSCNSTSEIMVGLLEKIPKPSSVAILEFLAARSGVRFVLGCMDAAPEESHPHPTRRDTTTREGRY